ncbi:MAG: cupin domain-containing protein [Acetobacteraceae bacterium]
MTDSASPLVGRDAASTMPLEPGRLSALMLRHGSMELRWYAPKGADPQVPHDKDEVYVVVSGSGRFVCGDRTVMFQPGDALFVPAQATHRFEDFSDDFATWVIFYGPVGGESP